MAECELLPSCDFFNDRMANMPATKKMIKGMYCLGDNSECARHIIYRTAGKGRVPNDLFPNEVERVAQILTSS